MRVLFGIVVLLVAGGLSACDRNIGPVPANEPEYDTLFFAGDVTAAKIPNASGVLFVAAVAPDGGPPSLVTRLEVDYWPVRFELSDLNRMYADGAVEGPHRLFARFDTDGDVNSKSPFDMEVRTTESYAVGATGITLSLQPITHEVAAKLAIEGTIAIEGSAPEGGHAVCVCQGD